MRLKGYFFMILATFLLLSNAKAQDAEQLALDYLKQADIIYKRQKEAIEVAKELYIKAAETDPSNVYANWMAGKLYTETIDKDRSTDYFIQVKALNPKYRFDIDYHIGRGYHYGLDFEKALEYYTSYKKKYLAQSNYRGKDKTILKRVERRMLECRNGQKIIQQPTQYSIEIVKGDINSPWPDYAPVLNESQDVMLFTSRRLEGNTSEDVDEDNFYFEDIFISRKQGDTWSKAENIGPPINTVYHEASISLSSDGNRLYIYKDSGGGDIYYSDYDGAAWSKPKFLTDKINSSSYSEGSVSETSSPDVIFYTSNRPGGTGGYDIYMCIKDKRGKWYKSKSIGDAINTKFNEDSPFLAHDGKTLYFSSEGHLGYGGFDIFKSVYDSLTETWSKPENLGYPVNTPDDEIYFNASKDGRSGYFASVREGGVGFTDIFKIKYHGAGGPLGKDIIMAQIQARNATATTNGAETASPAAAEIVDAGSTKFEAHETQLMAMAHRIFFNNAQSAIQGKHQAELDSIITMLNKYEVLNIDIAGFASSDGNPRYNLELSQKRAIIVLNYFVEKGIDESRIVARGFGSIKGPEGLTEESRRAEVRIISESRE